jgi:mRNA-degrading endonuclease RelE of RelBE toxin-antitoxin system
LQYSKELEDFPFVRLDIKRLAGKRNHYRLRVERIRVLFYYEKAM